MANQYSTLGLLTCAAFLCFFVYAAVGYPGISRVDRQILPPDPRSIEFPSGVRLTPVTSIDPSFNDPFEVRTVPGTQLFDSNGIEDVQLSTNFMVSDFLAPGLQYFRLSPRLVECLQRVVDKAGRALLVRNGYRQDPLPTLSPEDMQIREYSSLSGHIRGRAADIRFRDSSDQQSLILLAEYVVDECYPLFRGYNSDMDLGLLQRSIHVNFRGGFSSTPEIDRVSFTWAEEGASMTASDWDSWVRGRMISVETNITQNGGCILGATFRCRSGSCVIPTDVCDGEFDCGDDDNSDELGISSTCGRNSDPVISPTSPPPSTAPGPSSPSSSWGCFPANAVVQTDHATKTMMELQIGDKVLSVNSIGEVVYSSIVAFADKMPAAKLDYVRLETEDGDTLMLTAPHLIFRNRSTHMESVFASSIRPGDTIYALKFDAGRTDRKQALKLSTVTAVSTLKAFGAYGPVTTEGTIIVGGIAASCYAVVNDHHLIHASFAPLRYLNNLMPGAVGTEQEGLHWYPEFLLAVGRYILYTLQPFGEDLLYPGLSL